MADWLNPFITRFFDIKSIYIKAIIVFWLLIGFINTGLLSFCKELNILQLITVALILNLLAFISGFVFALMPASVKIDNGNPKFDNVLSYVLVALIFYIFFAVSFAMAFVEYRINANSSITDFTFGFIQVLAYSTIIFIFLSVIFIYFTGRTKKNQNT